MRETDLDEGLGDLRGPARGPRFQGLWDAARREGRFASYFSQAGQDWFLDKRVFSGERDGVFVDVGAYDGLLHSNTAFFEFRRGWDGLLIEASPDLAASAGRNRKAACVALGVGPKIADVEFLEVLEGYTAMSGVLATYDPILLQQVRAHPGHRERIRWLQVRPLGDILDEAGIAAVDYLSLDVEGAEREVLESFPFDRIPIRAWSIENNSGDPRIARLMAEQGYEVIEYIGVDEIYIPARA